MAHRKKERHTDRDSTETHSENTKKLNYNS